MMLNSSSFSIRFQRPLSMIRNGDMHDATKISVQRRPKEKQSRNSSSNKETRKITPDKGNPYKISNSKLHQWFVHPSPIRQNDPSLLPLSQPSPIQRSLLLILILDLMVAFHHITVTWWLLLIRWSSRATLPILLLRWERSLWVLNRLWNTGRDAAIACRSVLLRTRVRWHVWLVLYLWLAAVGWIDGGVVVDPTLLSVHRFVAASASVRICRDDVP